MTEKRPMMKALVLHGIGDARYEEIPKPQPGINEVLVRVAWCGVCGSDIPRLFEHGTYHFPTVCGHEFAGKVESCGPEVEGFAPDDRVVVFPLLWCGKCQPCEEGRYVQCCDYDYRGSRSDGAFAEYVTVPWQNLIKIPENVSLEEAAMTEPAAVALHALKRTGESLIGKTATIFGAGPIGLMAAQWARIMGATEVIIFDLVEEKLTIAKQLGFDKSYKANEVDPLQIINDLTNGEGADVCVEGVGVPVTFVQTLAATRRGGKAVILGNPAADVTIPAKVISQVMRREIDILGTWNSEFSVYGDSDDWRTVLNALANDQLQLKPLITHRVELADAFAALKMMKKQKEFFAKVLIKP